MKKLRFVFFVFVLFYSSLKAQDVRTGGVKILFSFEPNILAYTYFKYPGDHSPHGTAYSNSGFEDFSWNRPQKYHLPVFRTNFISLFKHKEFRNLKRNYFTYSSGFQAEVKLTDHFSISSGLKYLNESYEPEYSNRGSHELPTYTLSEYFAEYLRVPMVTAYYFRNRKATLFSVGAGINADFLVREKVFYLDSERGEVIKKGLFIMDRIVPQVSWGVKKQISSRFTIGYQVAFLFRSCYQHAHREFYFKNITIGGNLTIEYSFRRKAK